MHAALWNGSTVIDLGTLGGSNSYALAINSSGQVAGYSEVSGDAAAHAAVWNRSTATDLGTLGGTSSYATSINNSGQVAGYSATMRGDQHATMWNGPTATDMAANQVGFSPSQGLAINNAGQVAGAASSYPQVGGHAVIWNGTNTTNLETLGGHFSWGSAINDLGQVAGYSDGTGHATLWNGTKATDLGTLLGTVGSSALAINNKGQVVGYSGDSGIFRILGGGNTRATLWTSTKATDLNSFLDPALVNEGWLLTSANGINDNGWIVGDASNSRLGISNTAFLLAPIPEPTSYAMLLSGLGLLGLFIRRRKAN
jgi:probable HAF family extracellular repeat protein